MENKKLLFTDTNKNYVKRMHLRLKDFGIQGMLEEDSLTSSIFVESKNYEKSKKLLTDEFTKELQQEDEKILDYKKNVNRYNDFKSSAFSLLFVGIAGVIFMVLKITNIIHFSFQGIYDFIIELIFSLIFGFMMVLGIYFVLKAKKTADNIPLEEKFTGQILDWFKQNYSSEYINENIHIQENVPPYFNRMEFMRTLILTKFGDLDEGYRESILEDIYNEYFDD